MLAPFKTTLDPKASEPCGRVSQPSQPARQRKEAGRQGVLLRLPRCWGARSILSSFAATGKRINRAWRRRGEVEGRGEEKKKKEAKQNPENPVSDPQGRAAMSEKNNRGFPKVWLHGSSAWRRFQSSLEARPLALFFFFRFLAFLFCFGRSGF